MLCLNDFKKCKFRKNSELKVSFARNYNVLPDIPQI